MKQALVVYPGLKLDVVREELRRTPDGRRSLRLLALVKVMEGEQTQEVARFLDYGRHAVTDWIRRVNKEGLAGLDDRPGRGRRWQLSESQRADLATDLTASPKSFGFDTNLWTGSVVREHIARQFGVQYGLARVYELLALCGFTLQRPTTRYLGAKPEAVETFQAEVKKNLG